MLAESAQYDAWEEWKRTFVFIPKTDINGKLIFGRAWVRERFGTVLGDYEIKTGMTPVLSIRAFAYANNKDVFVEKLRDIMQ